MSLRSSQTPSMLETIGIIVRIIITSRVKRIKARKIKGVIVGAIPRSKNVTGVVAISRLKKSAGVATLRPKEIAIVVATLVATLRSKNLPPRRTLMKGAVVKNPGMTSAMRVGQGCYLW